MTWNKIKAFVIDCMAFVFIVLLCGSFGLWLDWHFLPAAMALALAPAYVKFVDAVFKHYGLEKS